MTSEWLCFSVITPRGFSLGIVCVVFDASMDGYERSSAHVASIMGEPVDCGLQTAGAD